MKILHTSDWHLGRSYHSTETLQALLDVIGHDNRDDVISDEVSQILKTDKLQEADAEFLIAVGKVDEAELYLLWRTDQLDGNHYGSLLSMAESKEATYLHGILYLKKVDKLATNVADWKEIIIKKLSKRSSLRHMVANEASVQNMR